MRFAPWLCTGLALAIAGNAPAQFFHKQRGPCCPVEPWTPAVEPPAVTPKGIDPAPKVEPPPPVFSESDLGLDLAGDEVTTFDSSVGYIDNAIPSNLLRLRIDAAWDANRLTRAEFFYARSGPLGPGLPRAELLVDYQEILTYVEGKLGPNWSAFVEFPVRFINPEINANAAGYGDMNFGFKYAFRYCPHQVASFQLRAWAPTGDAFQGLGNDHFSLEPALLYYQKLSDRLRLEAELRYWASIGGTNFAGDLIRYGVGLSYGERPADDWWLTPVVELVGWTVLDGLVATPPPIPPPVLDAAGDTIVNIKLGLRLGMGDIGDFYMGYGRALTGEVWYKDIWRTEFRLAF